MCCKSYFSLCCTFVRVVFLVNTTRKCGTHPRFDQSPRTPTTALQRTSCVLVLFYISRRVVCNMKTECFYPFQNCMTNLVLTDFAWLLSLPFCVTIFCRYINPQAILSGMNNVKILIKTAQRMTNPQVQLSYNFYG